MSIQIHTLVINSLKLETLIFFLTGKDNLPVNRYHPRETPNWQKKITCFYEKQVQEDLSEKDGIPEQSSHISHDGIPKQSSDISDDVRRKPKRTSSELDTTDDETSTNKSTFKRFKSNNNMEIDSEQAVISEVSSIFAVLNPFLFTKN